MASNFSTFLLNFHLEFCRLFASLAGSSTYDRAERCASGWGSVCVRNQTIRECLTNKNGGRRGMRAPAAVKIENFPENFLRITNGPTRGHPEKSLSGSGWNHSEPFSRPKHSAQKYLQPDTHFPCCRKHFEHLTRRRDQLTLSFRS